MTVSLTPVAQLPIWTVRKDSLGSGSLGRALANTRFSVFGYPEALNVDVAGEIQYLLGGKGNDALEALHHTPAMRVTIYLAKR